MEEALREVGALPHCLSSHLDAGDQLNGDPVAGLQTLGWRTQKELATLQAKLWQDLRARRAASAEGRAA